MHIGILWLQGEIETDNKLAPYNVTSVPPSAAPSAGHSDETNAAATWVNATPLELNCCAFINTSTAPRGGYCYGTNRTREGCNSAGRAATAYGTTATVTTMSK